ncbi:MAG: CGNR zinc finger domain-containing protein, partial [Actinocrinis sp.]
PGSARPEPAAARRLRAAIRDLLDSQLERRSALEASIEDINAASASVPTSPRLVHVESGTSREDSPWHGDGPWHGETRWHREQGGNAALAAIAREIIDLFSSPERLNRLRRCADPTCSMLFLAETARRQWCASNVCGNRARVARHYRRTHPVKSGGES